MEFDLRTYNPITKKLRTQGRMRTGLFREAINEGKKWSYPTFNAVCNGYLSDTEGSADIETWLIEKGFGLELKEAQENYKRIQAEKKAHNNQLKEGGNGQ